MLPAPDACRKAAENRMVCEKESTAARSVALHPYCRGMDLPREQLKDDTVRAWFSGRLYPENRQGQGWIWKS